MRHLNVVLIRPGSYRGKCIGIGFCFVWSWWFENLHMSSCIFWVLDSTFHFLSGLRALNHQIMSSDMWWVKRQDNFTLRDPWSIPCAGFMASLHFKSCYLVFHNQKGFSSWPASVLTCKRWLTWFFWSAQLTFTLLFCSYFIFCSSTSQSHE